MLAGTESQKYLDDARYIEIYGINTIANYDPNVITHLHTPVSSAFSRDGAARPLRSPDSPPA
ncbi:MAG: DUF2185 domain-containing protein [Planctomycetota bacterium]